MDAHVGRQLFEDALTGELGTGRTRILVTHHVGLVLPKTAYTVVLGEGTVQHAGLVEDLKARGVLEELMKQQQEGPAENIKKQEEELQHAEDAVTRSLSKVLSHATTSSKVFDDGELDLQGKAQPKKFTEDEKRETGRVNVNIYKKYIVSSGGFWFWGPIMILFAVYQVLILARSWFIGIWTRSYKTESHSFLVQDFPYRYQSFQESRPNFQTSNDDLSFYLGGQ